MNPPTLPSSVLLDGGRTFNAVLNSGATALVKVRLLPARHLNLFLSLREVGREAELLEYVVQRNTAAEGEPPVFVSPDRGKPEATAEQAAFIDSLSDESHATLVEIADELNFTRAVSQAERQIAKGEALLKLKQQMAETAVEPIKLALQPLISSLTTAIASAAAAKPPSANPSHG